MKSTYIMFKGLQDLHKRASDSWTNTVVAHVSWNRFYWNSRSCVFTRENMFIETMIM